MLHEECGAVKMKKNMKNVKYEKDFPIPINLMKNACKWISSGFPSFFFFPMPFLSLMQLYFLNFSWILKLNVKKYEEFILDLRCGSRREVRKRKMRSIDLYEGCLIWEEEECCKLSLIVVIFRNFYNLMSFAWIFRGTY